MGRLENGRNCTENSGGLLGATLRRSNAGNAREAGAQAMRLMRDREAEAEQ